MPSSTGEMRAGFIGLTPENVRRMSDAYFSTFNILFPILDRQIFLEDILEPVLRNGFADCDPQGCLVLLVLALGQTAIDGVYGSPISIIEGNPSGLRGGTAERPPGLNLFNEARRRMGFIMHQCTLENVQIHLLESESIDWSTPRADLIKRAYWACMLSEDMYHLELDLSQTGIHTLEDQVPLPYFHGSESNYGNPSDEKSHFQYHFLAMIALRRLVARIHESIHCSSNVTAELSEDYGGPPVHVIKELARQLESWRSLLPRPLQWSDNDKTEFPNMGSAGRQGTDSLFSMDQGSVPINHRDNLDIMTAQLRTQFYYARFMIYRPFVYKALHFPELMTEEDQICCALAIQSACLWPLILAPPKNKKRLVPHLFTWTQNFVGILLILRMTTENECLKKICNERVNRKDLEQTTTLMLEWIQDIKQVDGIAEWSWKMLGPLYSRHGRRRVPSEGALRVLRQLAYISSGTACGVAAVIAEERRRQTNVVSKIADNSRRLKQHPRYQHAHAARRRLNQDATHAHANDATLHTQAETFRNNVLPSEVERGYAKLESRQPHDVQTNRSSNPLPRPHPTTQVTSPQGQTPRVPASTSLRSPPSLVNAIEKHGLARTLAALELRCEKLVSQNLGDDAFRLFHQSLILAKSAGICPSDFKPLAVRLFDSFLLKRSFRNCQQLVDHMYLEAWPVTHCLHSFSLACIKPLRPRWLVHMNECYGEKFVFPRTVYPALCAAYATHSPKVCALLFAKHIHREQRLTVLLCCEPAWPAIIEQMWYTTRNYSLVDSLFEHMCQSTKLPPLVLYNAMIKVCIKSGNLDRAHHHLRTIQQSPHLEADIVTFGHFVLLTSSNADWPAVDHLMTMLGRAGEVEATPEKRTDLFIPVLKAYAKHHHPEEVWSFAFKAIDEYAVLPDPRILSIGINDLIRTGRLGMIPVWVNKMKTYGRGAEITSKTAGAMVRQFYFDTRPSHTVLIWLCRRLLNHVPEYWSQNLLNLLLEAVAHDLRGYRSGLAHREPRALLMLKALQEVDLDRPSLPKPLNWYQIHEETRPVRAPLLLSNSGMRETAGDESLANFGYEIDEVWSNDVSLASDRSVDYKNVPSVEDLSMDGMPDTALSTALRAQTLKENEMLIALSEARYADLLNMYESSLGRSGLPASSYSLEMAIQARTKLSDDVGLLEDHIDTASEAGMEITAALIPLLSHQIRIATPGAPMHIDELRDTVRGFYRHMVRNNVNIKHHLATASATVLIQNNQANEAIQLLQMIYHSKWVGEVPFDLPAMTVLLQAYIRVSHSTGIEWVIKEVLAKGYRIDYTFMTVVRKARKHAELRSRSEGSRGANNLRLARVLEYYSEVCRVRQKTQIRQASSLGNRLIRIMIKLAKPAPDVDVPKLQGQRVRPDLWSRGLRLADGRRSTWRIVGGRRKDPRIHRRSRRRTPIVIKE
ncbi:hypothetical protein E4T38_07355 [Aureobasidium subglaciale]|nr:hypothetical protein E4T38_07355 [Aureobasidium subglaciale]KAI5217493.1 hypothetical protein E4T40_07366 [Aureobasidium subglaciale]KAI5221015.1 hypothetical protein E4T41_07207 [Aureobasidium subglaciale]KAI5258544.1 hypothetical protein E4T46_07184 [Aureobasidium subglaciale]